MDLGLSGARALVTAASKGLGKACAAALAQEGARVFLVSRDDALLAQVEREMGAAGHLALDLSQPENPARAVTAAVDALGGLDILICNAGGPPAGTFQSTPLANWDKGYQLTLMSAVRLTEAALPHLKRSGRGRIINVTSTSVRQPIPNLVLSNAFRSAVTAMAKTLSMEVAGDNVTVNNLAPGTMMTDRAKVLYGDSIPEVEKTIPMGRLGTPEEYGAVCAFLCSLQAGYVTGQTLGVDGGLLKGVH
ncbi:MAG: SDR family oxidoreductase [Candidatus Dormibacteraeota bacterium]|nr:SDR family oxidoreductase [Candidatus Dormibacteraeota bacterium]